MFPDGGLAGLIDGGFLALPSTRPDGSYYTLLTIGFAEICRIFVQKQKPLTPMNGSINNVDSFIPDERFLQRPGLLLGFAGAFALMLLALLTFRAVNSERLGMLLQTAREDDAFAEAIVRHGLHLHGVNRPVRSRQATTGAARTATGWPRNPRRRAGCHSLHRPPRNAEGEAGLPFAPFTYLAFSSEHLSHEAPIAQAITAHTPVLSERISNRRSSENSAFHPCPPRRWRGLLLFVMAMPDHHPASPLPPAGDELPLGAARRPVADLVAGPCGP
jgi:hypothetical protein